MPIENPFKDAEKLLFAKVLDRMAFAQKKGRAAFTDFIDPARCSAFLSALEKNPQPGMSFAAYGGYEEAERRMLGFGTGELEFPLTPLSISFNERFSKPPAHRDYLGAVLGLGLDRGKIGDVRLGEAGAVLYASNEVAAYICENLRQVKRVAVKTTQGELVRGTESAGQEKRVTVPSLRLDAVLSSAFNLSRGKAAMFIESEKVFVNWKTAKKTQNVSEGDVITIRGVGRVKIEKLEGNTKKDRLVIQILKFS